MSAKVICDKSPGYAESPKLEFDITDVLRNGYNLQYISNKTPEICLAAVRQNGLALTYVREQTPEICLAAVQQNGLALAYVTEQTPEICLAAVQQNGASVYFVKDQTYDISLEAVRKTPNAWEFFTRCKGESSDEFFMRKEKLKRVCRIAVFREELMEVTWHPDYRFKYCMDEDEKQEFGFTEEETKTLFAKPLFKRRGGLILPTPKKSVNVFPFEEYPVDTIYNHEYFTEIKPNRPYYNMDLKDFPPYKALGEPWCLHGPEPYNPGNCGCDRLLVTRDMCVCSMDCQRKPLYVWALQNQEAFSKKQKEMRRWKTLFDIWWKQKEDIGQQWDNHSRYERCQFQRLQDEESPIGCASCERFGSEYCKCECEYCGSKYCNGMCIDDNDNDHW